jgi:two-component system NtrC family sensor kinase
VQNRPVPITLSPAIAAGSRGSFLGPKARGVVALGFRALWAAAVLVPLLALIGAGFATWHAVEQAAGARIERTVGLLHENALRAFGTQEAILAAITQAMAGREPAALQGDAAFHRLLAELAASGAPVVSGILVADRDARIVSASWEHPARPADLSDRDYVTSLAAGMARVAVGAPVASRPMGWDIIPVARRAPPLPDRDELPGLVVSSFSPQALAAFYATVAENPRDVVALFRDDGTPLARHPPDYDATDPGMRPRILAMLRQLLAPGAARVWVVSAVDAEHRLFAARRVGDWPVVVAYGMTRDALAAEWRHRMLAPVLGGASAMALLLALTGLAQRGARMQQDQAEQRAEAEAQLARAGRAASLGLLAAGLAHDVKNLVQSVRSGARVMERSATEPAEVRRCARLLADAADRGGRLVDAMLAFARGGAAPDEPAPPLDVAATLAPLSDLLARTLGSGWRVRTQLPPALPRVHADRAGFEAAVVNLAANARDAMPQGGVVTITAHEALLEEGGGPPGLRPGRYVVAAVRDTGTGMDEATLARLGEPFFTTKPPGIGTGLGLATVRGFCTRAGGALQVESAPGQGTTAAIWLPAAP